MRVVGPEESWTAGKYYVDYLWRGKRIRLMAGTSKRSATTLRLRIENEIHAGKHDPALLKRELRGESTGSMTFGQLCDQFLKLYKGGASFYYQQSVKIFQLYLAASLPVNEITPIRVQAFRKWMEQERKYGPASTRKRLIALGTIFRWAVRAGVYHENPAHTDKVDRPSEPRGRDRFLTEIEFEKLCEACEPELRRIVRFLVHSGVRLSTPCKLRWNDLDTRTGWVYVPKGKTPAYRVPYTPLLEEIVGSRPRHLRSDFVFCQPDGTQLNANWLSKNIKAAMKRAGIENASAHTLRHTFGSWMTERGESAKFIGEVLGQSTAYTTQRYQHLTPEYVQRRLKEAHEKGTPDEASAKKKQA